METVQAPTLETERLLLRPFRGSDLDDYTALRADPEVLRYLVGAGGEPWDRGRSSRHLAFMIGHWQIYGTGTWAVEHKETGAFIGIAGFSEPEGWPGLELAWTLAREHWGQGYATEAAREALAYAFTTLKRERVISLIHPENRASIRVAERIGEKLLDRINHLGQEMLRYGIDRETYLTQAAGPGTFSPPPVSKRKRGPNPGALHIRTRGGKTPCLALPSRCSACRSSLSSFSPR